MQPRAQDRRLGRLLTRYEDRQSKSMEKMRGNLMLVATVIATMTFQIAINPPGGVLQENTDNLHGCFLPNNQNCTAGTSVFAHFEQQIQSFNAFLIVCTISFSASLTIIILLISGFPLSNRVTLWTLMIAMCISIYCTVAAYLISIRMVMDPPDETVKNIIWVFAMYWIGLGVLIFLILLIRLLYWLVKKLLVALCKGCCFFVKLGKCKGHENQSTAGNKVPEMSTQV